MEKPERSTFTAASEIANERLIEAVLDPDRYPEGTTSHSPSSSTC
jgi:hypothetical protein